MRRVFSRYATAFGLTAIWVSFANADEVGKIALKVIESTIEAPGVERQCQGTFVVKNVGPAFQIPPNVVGPSYGVFIYDEHGKLLFRNYGGWGPGMKVGGTIRLSWNTSSNHLGETSEPPFLVPAPGRYRLEIVLSMGRKRERVLDVFSKWFEVPAVTTGADLGDRKQVQNYEGRLQAREATNTQPDRQLLKQQYAVFVASLNHRQLAEDYPGAVRKLDSPDPKQQIVGIKTLAATDEVRAIPWIVPLLDSEDRHVRIYAGQSLSAIVAAHELKRRDKTEPGRVVIKPPGPGDVCDGPGWNGTTAWQYLVGRRCRPPSE